MLCALLRVLRPSRGLRPQPVAVIPLAKSEEGMRAEVEKHQVTVCGTSFLHLLLSEDEARLVARRLDAKRDFKHLTIGQRNLPLTNDRMIQLSGSSEQIRDSLRSVVAILGETEHLLEGARRDPYSPPAPLVHCQSLGIPQSLVYGALGENYTRLKGILRATATRIHLSRGASPTAKVVVVVSGRSADAVTAALTKLIAVVTAEVERVINALTGHTFTTTLTSPARVLALLWEDSAYVRDLARRTSTRITTAPNGQVVVVGYDAPSVEAAVSLMDLTVATIQRDVLPYYSPLVPKHHCHRSGPLKVPKGGVQRVVRFLTAQSLEPECTTIRFTHPSGHQPTIMVVHGKSDGHVQRMVDHLARVLSA